MIFFFCRERQQRLLFYFIFRTLPELLRTSTSFPLSSPPPPVGLRRPVAFLRRPSPSISLRCFPLHRSPKKRDGDLLRAFLAVTSHRSPPSPSSPSSPASPICFAISEKEEIKRKRREKAKKFDQFMQGKGVAIGWEAPIFRSILPSLHRVGGLEGPEV